MRIYCLPLPHVLISIRIGNEPVNPYCAVMPNRANQRALERIDRFKAVSRFHLRGFEYRIISVLKHVHIWVKSLFVTLWSLHAASCHSQVDWPRRDSLLLSSPVFLLSKENRVYVHLAVSPNSFWTNWRVFLELGINIISSLFLLIFIINNTNMAAYKCNFPDSC
jgi:hypothetical protein